MPPAWPRRPAISAPSILDSGRLDDAEEEFNVALDAAHDAGEGRGIAMQMRNLAVLAAYAGVRPRKPAAGFAGRSNFASRSRPTPKRSS